MKIGDRFKSLVDEGEYILALSDPYDEFEAYYCTLINISTGLCWSFSAMVDDIHEIKREELNEIANAEGEELQWEELFEAI